jgi:pyruvate dehydrogenase E2 component (dihydrolipoyllysine-residue acetyltransferase)
MATEIKLPRLGQGMESGTIVKWLKSEGEPVAKGEPLYELDTDKVTQEVEADASGVLLKIAVQEGEVEVGRTIAVIGEEGEEVSVDSSSNGAQAEQVAEREQEEGSRAPERDQERQRGRAASAETATTQGQSLGHVQTRDGGRIKASPLARRIARERGVDIAQIRGTGPDGRIVAEDVERAETASSLAPAAAAPAGEVEVRQLTSVRKTIARRLTQAWQAPVFQLTVSVDMTSAQALVQQLRELHPDERPTITDVLTRVTASALIRHRDVNAHYVDDEIRIHPSANVGIAVAAPQGLVVPVIRGAERLTIAEIARVRGEVVQRARDNKLRQEDLQDGTFTISNLGMFGVEQFIAVLNPPQVAILAVGATEDKVVVRDGQFAAQPTMTMTLTCDHRAIDGAVGAQFLQTLAQFVEQPALAL